MARAVNHSNLIFMKAETDCTKIHVPFARWCLRFAQFVVQASVQAERDYEEIRFDGANVIGHSRHSLP